MSFPTWVSFAFIIELLELTPGCVWLWQDQRHLLQLLKLLVELWTIAVVNNMFLWSLLMDMLVSLFQTHNSHCFENMKNFYYIHQDANRNSYSKGH